MAVFRVRHINDFDFDLSTSEQLPDKEELTETIFALVTYRAQVAGRLLNFPEPEKLDGVSRSTSGASSPAWAAFPNQEQRQKYVSQFQQQALVLDLEKAQLMYSDPGGEGFRWYVTILWLALSTAIAGCNTCTDTPLVHRAWPVIEASYRQYESCFSKNRGEIMQCPLAFLMNQTRQRLSSSLQAGNPFEHSLGAALSGTCTSKGLPHCLSGPFVRESTRTPVDPLLGSGNSLPNRSSSSFEASYIVSATQLVGAEQVGH